MRDATPPRRNIGDLQPSHLLHSFGVGSIVELPNLSVMVMGLDDWPVHHCREISEPRLLKAIQDELGSQVSRLLTPPIAPDSEGFASSPFDESANIGVPVAPFPRWLLCPRCRLLAPISSGLFELKLDPFRKDRSRYVHRNCNRPHKANWQPTAVPARFLVACEDGHLNDFPWVEFVHRGPTHCRSELRLYEMGASGEVADIRVQCHCGAGRSLVEAFVEKSKRDLPPCDGRWPHLRSRDDDCGNTLTAILLGASNSWFPLTMSALSIPSAADQLAQLVEEHWAVVEKATSIEVLQAFRQIGQLRPFVTYSDTDLWNAIEARRSGVSEATEHRSLREPEWLALSNPDPALNGRNFRLREVAVPDRYDRLLERVVLAESLREVRSLIGFTRIEAPDDLSDPDDPSEQARAPLCRDVPHWLPSLEVHGEGLFIQFSEEAIEGWLQRVSDIDGEFIEAHRRWRHLRKLDPDKGYPGMRYVLLHSFSHCLMRQLTLECGYTAASIRERIYSREGGDAQVPMAGVLLYTAAPDSEGTLGGLVSLGQTEILATHLTQALDEVGLCASDPLCSEHQPSRDALTLHGAACHACLFAPETSCERGNKYLDRSVLIPTVERDEYAFFGDRQ